MSEEIYDKQVTEMSVVSPALSGEMGFEILKNKVNELLVQFEILKKHVKILKEKVK